jgi:hypothetical protein
VNSALALFFAGFFGAVHCIGMCGGVVTALVFGLHGRFPLWLALWVYNAGRLLSYVLAGMLMGGLGGMVHHLADWHVTRQIAALLNGLFMIAMGGYLAGRWLWFRRLETWGGLLWQRLAPYSRRLLPLRSVAQAFLLGMLWGWLPCGLVYSALLACLTTTSALEGGVWMAAFWLGTLPALLLAGSAGSYLKKFLQDPRLRPLAGFLVIFLGLHLLWREFFRE